ncbi:hypothetical protein LJN55_22020 [Erwinia rhapontici]|uniref:hypothetical protein n=1 Tax=Erwinia rhapontici TaxID=55212 RepID=UPI001D0DA8D4|nr:hypothetical protein [Erwinia rhapontici]UDQ80051.1 hypothetical protein LJN55_22020 [Erwinia rhapontici]
MKRIVGWFSGMLLLSLSMNGYALDYGKVAFRYSDCRMIDNGDGTSTVSVNIYYSDILTPIVSRGFLLYNYTADGVPVSVIPNSFSLGGYPGNLKYVGEGGYVMLYGSGGYWGYGLQISLYASITFNSGGLSAWPAVFIRAGNRMYGTDMADNTGTYITLGGEGTCKSISTPTNPPKPDPIITVTAPDWDLGEIKNGEQVIPFSASSDQLCLRYTDSGVANKQFIINASNQNGMVNNQYQLKGLQDNTQSIPYQLTLDSGSSKIDLPNTSLSALPLLEGGKTCFMPIFRTFAPKGIKKGDYSDVLTFTIATKA